MNTQEIKNLKALYEITSKHSNYQILTPELEKFIGKKNISTKSRSEEERFKYILKNTEISQKKVIDIGGNTGYFSFSSLDAGAKHVTYIEGNRNHSDFVSSAAKILSYKENISIIPNYVNLEEDKIVGDSDVIFLLNVLHHIGDDYGNTSDKNIALNHISNVLKKLASKTNILIFQLGFNWKGNSKLPLFENGTKLEMINFIKKASDQYWNIKHIGIAEGTAQEPFYEELNNTNMQRNNALGEFLNRPIFILETLVEK